VHGIVQILKILQ